MVKLGSRRCYEGGKCTESDVGSSGYKIIRFRSECDETGGAKGGINDGKHAINHDRGMFVDRKGAEADAGVEDVSGHEG